MKKKMINLYFDFEFTSLSPDAQPISLGIISDGQEDSIMIPVSELSVSSQSNLNQKRYVPKYLRIEGLNNGFLDDFPLLQATFNIPENEFFNSGYVSTNVKCGIRLKKSIRSYLVKTKSFYAEFSDFDINRCDDWVKENVVKKLNYPSLKEMSNSPHNAEEGNIEIVNDTQTIKTSLKHYIDSFKDYDIQFVCDCGTFDWYWMLQLIDEREKSPCQVMIHEDDIPANTTLDELIDDFKKSPCIIYNSGEEIKTEVVTWHQSGLPILPNNISPVPQDINNLIAFKKQISVKEAFSLNREKLAYGINYDIINKRPLVVSYKTGKMQSVEGSLDESKHNALFDAKVIKMIYDNLR